MIIEIAQTKIIKILFLAVAVFIKFFSDNIYCLECNHFFDFEDLLDSGGGVCPYCASSRIIDLNELSYKEQENLIWGVENV